jgi:oligopeptide transport system substrate-binding protein
VYAWNRAVNPDTAADYEYMFEVIAGYDKGALDVKATDDKTLVVKLTSAVPYFLELCAFPTYYPVQKATIDKGGDAWATEAKTYISNGAYVMKEWVHDSYILLEKNKNYWNAKAVGPETIKFILMDDDSAILAAFEKGEILFADTMPNAEIEALKKTEFYFQSGQLGTYYVSYNCEKAPFNDPRVRQALTLAIDRDFIVKKIGQAGQVPAGAFVSIGMSDADPTKEFRTVGGDYYDPNASANAANIAKAKELLAQAGFPDGKGFPVFEYLYNTSSGHKAIAEALQNMWKTNLNISCELVSQEWNTFLQTRKNGEYQVARNGWLADYNDPISFLDMWITGGGNNDAQWSNTEYDKLISEVKASGDRNTRFTKMHQAEDILFEEWVLCPIYYYVDIFLKSPKLDGFFNSPLGFKNFIYSSVKTDAK